ncbi:hypothetical protein G6F56_010052 [Rhizopus delemar]|nr:hypothetical protein G6F56_010052 [Rhizopus delemar]
MSQSSFDPFQIRQIPAVQEENDPYRVRKNHRHLNSDSSDFDIAHSRTASDCSTSKLHNSTTDSNDPYSHYKQPKKKFISKEPYRVNSYLPYSNHYRNPKQPFTSFTYIEDELPRASTTLGIGSLLYDNLPDHPIHPPPIHSVNDQKEMLSELPKKKKQKHICCGLGYRSIALITFLCLSVIAIIWYFVWPRVPGMSLSSASDDTSILVVTNSTINSITMQWNLTLTADNTENWVPTRFHSIDLVLYDHSTSVVFGNGSSKPFVLAAKKKSQIVIPVQLHYETDTLDDATFQDLYNTCGVQVSSSSPSDNTQDLLNVTIHVAYHMVGISWTPTTSINIQGLSCPTS